MSVDFARPVGTPLGNQPAQVASPAKETGGGFGQLMDGLLKDVSAQQLQADSAVRGLAAGRTDSLHNVMLSLAQADLSFRLVLEIRNRLTDAYQEIMRMQV
jgi:flagellar hook-basal body complex protein FliE